MNFSEFCRKWNIDPSDDRALALYDAWVRSLPLYDEKALISLRKKDPGETRYGDIGELFTGWLMVVTGIILLILTNC